MARETCEQAFLTTKPHVDFDIEDDSDEPMVGIAIRQSRANPVSEYQFPLLAGENAGKFINFGL
jgi:hypothetical protein